MRIKKAYLTSLALIPTTIVPLTTNTSCSQVWGFKSPLSIGTTVKGGLLDPFGKFTKSTSLVDLNGDPIVNYLQSNYAIDTRSNNYYSYSLPEKWVENTDTTVETTKDAEGKVISEITWKKDAFADSTAGWKDYNSSDFVKSATRSGERKLTSKENKDKVAEYIYSYRNNTLSNTTQLVPLIATTINAYINYALQYQGTQIGTEWTKATETDSNLAISWGSNLTHGAKDDWANRQFYESVFASNAVSGTEKSEAIVHPTHVEFNFENFPIVAYSGTKGNITGVNPETLKLLNGLETTGEPARPSHAAIHYYSSKSDGEEQIYNIRTDKTDKNKYTVYTYTNVPVVVTLNAFSKAYVNPRKTDGFMVADYYSKNDRINAAVGNSWNGIMNKFAAQGEEKPIYANFTYIANELGKEIDPLASGDKHDRRVDLIKPKQNSFIVLLNFAYKQYTEYAGDKTELECAKHDRVTMTGLSNVFPTYFIDSNLRLGKEDTFFKLAINNDQQSGYIFDTDKINKYNNLFMELVKRSAGQGLVTEAKNLNDTSKQLLKFLGYIFGTINGSTIEVNTSDILKPVELWNN